MTKSNIRLQRINPIAALRHATHVMNRLVTLIILAAVFFLIVTPVGWIMRALGRNRVWTSRQLDQQSCRVPSRHRDAKHVEHPY